MLKGKKKNETKKKKILVISNKRFAFKIFNFQKY